MDKRLSRRDFLRATSFVAGATFLAACAPQRSVIPEAAQAGATAGAPTPVNPAAVQWWVGWGELVPMFDSFKQMAS